MNPITPCDKKPNCACTIESKVNPSSYMRPLKIETNPIEKIAQILIKEGIKVIKKENNYLEAIAVSKFFKWKDDVTFYYDLEKKVLHFKSKSRTGHYDLGVNKKRISTVLAQLI